MSALAASVFMGKKRWNVAFQERKRGLNYKPLTQMSNAICYELCVKARRMTMALCWLGDGKEGNNAILS